MDKDKNILLFLNMILDGLNFSMYDFGQHEAPIIELAKELGYAAGFKLEKANFVNPPNYEYYVVELPDENIRVTKEGYDFLKKNQLTNFEKTEFNLKRILIDIDENSKIRNSNFNDIEYNDYKELISKAIDRNYLSGVTIDRSGQGNKKIMVYDNNPELTTEGNDYIKGKKEHAMTTNNTFNINSPVTNSSFGSDITMTNNIGLTTKDLLDIINSLDEMDQQQGKELLEVLKTEEPKLGFLKKFDNLLGKYPNLTEAVNNSLMLMATVGVAFIP